MVDTTVTSSNSDTVSLKRPITEEVAISLQLLGGFVLYAVVQEQMSSLVLFPNDPYLKPEIPRALSGAIVNGAITYIIGDLCKGKPVIFSKEVYPRFLKGTLFSAGGFFIGSVLSSTITYHAFKNTDLGSFTRFLLLSIPPVVLSTLAYQLALPDDDDESTTSHSLLISPFLGSESIGMNFHMQF
ncbi:MAG TPA: hypothetical protein VIX80_06730 [Candidatus Kapabacteria bacterium]